ncbi:DUF4127 family protein [Pseudonocardia kunmingensis]|uniref:Uncharacterized protein DUF4127 n=1 Tax=Pseudonocardia kunmingensis TaxID=630975 RepID=A0A543DIE8_9PSEU|nr:DUF4127 family protein [Pseudonocardia kunmingensis]TQM09108.1 uncharacterized protein DUF4127 [Pseudonocardia kunmingensis]
MMRRHTFLAAGLAGISTAVLAPTLAWAAPPQRPIAVVPLDDRPVNVYCAAITAAVAGRQVVFPPRDALGRFFQPGDGAAVARWLAAADTREFVISVSMLAYGGLIASRTAEPTLDAARANVEAIRALRRAKPDATILVHDMIQRLALTSKDPELSEYITLIVQWTKLYDQVENLGQEELRAQLDEVRAKIPDAMLDDYLAARGRNHEINTLMVDWVADGTITHLVLSEDDTAPVGLGRAERVELERRVAERGIGDRVEIFPGADEVDALLVARLIPGEAAPSFRLDYSGVPGAQWTAELEGIPFEDNIRRHVATVGGTVGDGEIVLAVNTPSASPERRAADVDAFTARIATHLAAGTPVIVVDPVFVDRADHDLVARLERDVELPRLLSYSGWNTGGNALGLALSHGVARWALLGASGSGLACRTDLGEPGRAHAEYLLYRFVKDDPWKNVIQKDAYAEARARGWNPLSLTAEQKVFFDGWVRERLVPVTRQYFTDHFAGHDLVLGRRGSTTVTARLDDLGEVVVELPWDRLFEVTLEPQVTLSAAAVSPSG